VDWREEEYRMDVSAQEEAAAPETKETAEAEA
jgi:hypothetical protein